MKYPFDASEKSIYEFEQLLKKYGLTIAGNSDLERICMAVLETNAKHKKEIIHDDAIDIRETFSDVAGIIDFVFQILKHQNHKDFHKLIPHLKLLNTSGTAVLTTRSKVTDSGNNKLFELYIALLCMAFSKEVHLDDPDSSKGDNPDIIFSYRNETWAIACKALHANKERTLYDAIEKGTDQINNSSATKGLVVVNLKNIINRDEIWPITNMDEFTSGAEPLFGCFENLQIPVDMLRAYGTDFQSRLVRTIGLENLSHLTNSGKCPAGFLIFLHALTAARNEEECPPTILKTFNLVQLTAVDGIYLSLSENLNESMHNRI